MNLITYLRNKINTSYRLKVGLWKQQEDRRDGESRKSSSMRKAKWSKKPSFAVLIFIAIYRFTRAIDDKNIDNDIIYLFNINNFEWFCELEERKDDVKI